MPDHTATIHGRTHTIPDIWLAGMAQQGYDTHAAITHWDAQALMEKQAETPEQLTTDERAYLAELVDAAIEAAPSMPSRGVRVHRLSRAVTDFRGPQEPPEPAVQILVGCPACAWHRTATSGDKQRQLGEAFREHYRMSHQGGKP